MVQVHELELAHQEACNKTRVPLENFENFETATYYPPGAYVAGSRRWEDCMAWVDEVIARRARQLKIDKS